MASDSDEPVAGTHNQVLCVFFVGYDWRTKYALAAMVVVQTYIATQVSSWSTAWMLVVAYLVGGTITHGLTLGIHEICHNLAFASPIANRLYGMAANLPLLFAYSISFRKYHLEHHKWQGVEGIDMDVPTVLETKLFNSRLGKFVWMSTQALFYALRPVLAKPYKPGKWEALNWVVCLTYDAILYYNYGVWSLVYLLLSLVMGLGLHPIAGHFIAEHYVFVPGHETYSYYGPLNPFFAFWVGYHNEHHDFPRIPGSRLHEVREMAPDYYKDLPQYHSWAKVIIDFITSPSVGPFARVKRMPKSKRN